MIGTSTELPKYVHRRKRDGVILFRKRYGQKIFETRMCTQFPEGDEIPDSLSAEVAALLSPKGEGSLEYAAPDARPLDAMLTPGGLCAFTGMEKAAKARANKYGLFYDLPDGWCLEQFERQERACVVTGIPFRRDAPKHSPFMPSLDRIDPKAGYTAHNCRLVAYIVNCALNQFGEDRLKEMCLAAVAHNDW